MRLERNQSGKASDTKPGDWIIVFSKNPRSRSKDPKLQGGSFFDVVESVAELTPQTGNSRVKLLFRGSISGNTRVLKTGGDTEKD